MIRYFLALTLLVTLSFADLRIDTTYTTIGAVAKKIGGDQISVTVLSSPRFYPHFIVPKPSLISKLRRADLLIINGGGLEIGWLPPLLKSANNGDIRPGGKGFLDLSHLVTMIDKPQSVSRAYGDIHAEGNPHYVTDPHTLMIIAKAIEKKLGMLDPGHATYYADNLQTFLTHWQTFLKTFDASMQQCRDKQVIQYHELFNYFLSRYGYESLGNIEPLPGIAPSSKHTIELIEMMKKKHIDTVIQDVYHERKSAEFIASKAAAHVVILPHELKAVEEADTLEHFYETIAKRLCH